VPLDEARSCFETNFFGIVAIVQAFAPLLISAQGLIINIGSVAAIVPYVYGSIYNASKAALHAWSQTLRLELEPYGVRVMVVVTGGIQSRIARTKRALPEGSLYLEVNDEFQRRVSHSQENAMPNQVYARGVVAEALRKNPRKWVSLFLYSFSFKAMLLRSVTVFFGFRCLKAANGGNHTGMEREYGLCS
jgi:1-acylglycerone phosphate reductase